MKWGDAVEPTPCCPPPIPSFILWLISYLVVRQLSSAPTTVCMHNLRNLKIVQNRYSLTIHYFSLQLNDLKSKGCLEMGMGVGSRNECRRGTLHMHTEMSSLVLITMAFWLRICLLKVIQLSKHLFLGGYVEVCGVPSQALTNQSYFLTYYSILLFSNLLPNIFVESSIILYLLPIILNSG